jgi:hypothetical protein
MWLPIIASVAAVGLSLSVIYFTYTKIQHPDVVFSSRKKVLDFLQDSFASLIQGEPPPMFKTRPTCSAGKAYLHL